MKKLDENLPSDLEEILDKKHGEMEAKFPSEDSGLESLKDKRSVVSAEKQVVSTSNLCVGFLTFSAEPQLT